MLDLTIIFLLISLISFTGSLQPGPVNMTVFKNTLNHGFRNGFITALGGSLPELLYSFLALWFSSLIFSFGYNELTVSIVVGSILILIGSYYLFKQHVTKSNTTKKGPPFLTGLSMGMLNPLLFTFWLTISTWMYSMKLMDSANLNHKLVFVSGTFFGAFVFLVIVAWLASKAVELKFLKNTKSIDLLIGSILILMGLWLIGKSLI